MLHTENVTFLPAPFIPWGWEALQLGLLRGNRSWMLELDKPL